jgi:GTP cyclohydrolase I
LNQKRIEELWKEILKEIGEDNNRVGLQDTPKRIAKMYKELFRGYDEDQKPKITTFPNGQDGVQYEQMIIDTGSFYSHCEHHGVPFFGDYWFAYIPSKTGKILGLSKVARVVDYFAAKLQVQERLTQEIVDCLWKELSNGGPEPKGMVLVMKGKHLCKSMRGAKKEGWMTTSEVKGEFLTPSKGNPLQEFLQLIKLNGSMES